MKIFIIILYSISFLGCAPSEQPGELINPKQVCAGEVFKIYLGQGFIGQDVFITINDAFVYSDNTLTATNGIAASIICLRNRYVTIIKVGIPAHNISLSYKMKDNDKNLIISLTNNYFKVDQSECY